MTIEAGTQTIHVVRTEIEKSGINRRTGNPWTLYRVYATDGEHGGSFTEELRSFDALPTGEVEVIFISYEKGGWTLKLPQRSKAKAKPGEDAELTTLRERVARLERQMRALLGNADIEIPANNETGV